MKKLAYRPFGLLVSVLGGLAAGAIFRWLWRTVMNEEKAPTAIDPDRSWAEITVAAALEGAVFGGVRALIDRAGATGFARATGTWPAE